MAIDIQAIIDKLDNKGYSTDCLTQAINNIVNIVVANSNVEKSNLTIIIPTFQMEHTAYTLLASEFDIHPIQVIGENTDEDIINRLDMLNANVHKIVADSESELQMRCGRLVMTLFRGAYLIDNKKLY